MKDQLTANLNALNDARRAYTSQRWAANCNCGAGSGKPCFNLRIAYLMSQG